MSDSKTKTTGLVTSTSVLAKVSKGSRKTNIKNEEAVSVLRFAPLFRTVRWGGRRLAAFKGVDLPTDRVGESWEISPLEGMETFVAEGPFEGMTLETLIRRYGTQIMGERLCARYGDRFPLLIKFLDAADDFSIQVHPDDQASNGNGKTELWYIIEASGGAHIYSGLNRELSAEEMRQRLDKRTLVNVLAKHYPQSGDVFYIPAGRVHSAGAGNFILEIQQASDITYRLWDWDRRDSHGRLRELHVDRALAAIDYSQTDYGLARPQLLDDRETMVKRTEFFTVTTLNIVTRVRLQVAERRSFRVLVAVDGAGIVTDPEGRQTVIERGQTLLVPAAIDNVDIVSTADTPLRLITVYIE